MAQKRKRTNGVRGGLSSKNLFAVFLSDFVLCFVRFCPIFLAKKMYSFKAGCVHAGKLLTKHVTIFRVRLPPSIQTWGPNLEVQHTEGLLVTKWNLTKSMNSPKTEFTPRLCHSNPLMNRIIHVSVHNYANLDAQR